jgi:hypothetical protein
MPYIASSSTTNSCDHSWASAMKLAGAENGRIPAAA